jgi:murein DD-endopeptidase MepM/ murein hydrolase activator NlpD
MRKRLEHYWKYSLVLISMLFMFQAFAQDSTVSEIIPDIELQTEVKPIEHWNFDLGLLPAQSIYGTSWSEDHVDSPAYDAEQMKWGYLLDLAEEGCDYVHPFKGVITSKYGWRRSRWHKGIDIDLEIGDPVHAAFDGVVRIQRYNAGGFGTYVMIRHYNGLETIYGHLSEAIVVRNQTVRAGQVIGYGGSTGRSTGSHLHFETRLNGQAFDPARIIDFQTFQLKGSQAFVNNTWFPYIKGNSTNVRPATAKRYHKIRKGDTLYAIARRNGTTVNSICRLNRISRNTTLRVGRTLRVK